MFSDSNGTNEITEAKKIDAKGHDYTSVTPTWSWEGYTSVIATFKCSRDNHEENIKATIAEEVTIEPTCTEEGIRTYTATVTFNNNTFKDTKTESIPAKGHDLTHHDKVEATCTTDGKEEYYECSVCNKLFSDSEGTAEITSATNIPATGHTYDQKSTDSKYLVSEATCSSPAVYNFSCTCGEKGSETFTYGDPLGHKLTHHDKVDATCTTNGSEEYYTCSNCNKMFSDSTGTSEITEAKKIEALGHDYGEVTYTWNNDYSKCTATRTCSNDSTHTETLTASGDQIKSSITKEVTCTENGSTTYTATFSEDWAGSTSKTVTERAYGHDWLIDTSNLVSPATCHSYPQYYRVCSRCNLKSDKTVSYGEMDENNHTSENIVWTYDDENHWQVHECCNRIVGEKEAHVFGTDGKCTTCGATILDFTLTFTLNSEGNAYSVKAKNKDVTNIVIPDTYNDLPVTSIDEGGFSYCYSLKTVSIGSSVTSISNNAFRGCRSLRSVTIGENVTSIGDYAFANCTSLTSITIPASVASVGDWVFLACYRLVEVRNLSSSISPEIGSVSAGYLAYYAKVILTNESDSTIISEVGDWTFYTFDGNKYLLRYNGSETSVTLPDETSVGSKYTIASYAFYYYDDGVQTKITDLILTQAVSSIESDAFLFTSIKSIYYKGSTEEYSSITNDDSSNLTSTYVIIYYYSEEYPTGNDNYWHYDTDGNVTIWDTETLVENNLKYTLLDDDTYSVKVDDTSVTSIIIPDTINGKKVTKIEDYAFKDCESLQTITIGDNVTSIGKYAFQNCKKLDNVVIPESVTTYGDDIFNNCISLTDVSLPSNLTEVPRSMFVHCINLKTVDIPDTVTKINDYAFFECYNLQSITIPANVTEIGTKNTFKDCYRLVEIRNLSNITLTIGNSGYGQLAQRAKVILTNETDESIISTIDDYDFYTLNKGTDSEKKYLLCYNGSDETVTLPSESTVGSQYELAPDAFYGEDTIKDLTFSSDCTGFV